MEMLQFIETMLWVIIQPIIGWAVIDLINVPAYVKMCKQLHKQRQEQEMLEISTMVADAFHRSIGK